MVQQLHRKKNNIRDMVQQLHRKKKQHKRYGSAADSRGGSRGAHPARAPPKIGKNKIFWHKKPVN
jgi:hypothetical protein